MSVVGIDLGTTNTVVACVRAGKVHVLADEHGARLLPSVVSFHPNGDVLVGAAAKARRVIDAKNTVYSHKRLIGRSWGSAEIAQAKQRFAFDLKEGPGQGPLIHARGQDYTLPEMSAFVLKRARQIAETALGQPVERAVITVPAHFNELQRASTKVAGRVSGLEVLRILNEPTAAALAYGLGRTGNERVAVYDFGGGTFDCTLLDLNGNVFEVLATAGDSFLGGDDVDTLIADRMAEVFLKEHRYDARSDPQMLERLRTNAEDVKIGLSTAESHTVVLKDFGFGAGGAAINFAFTMTRRDLDAMVTPLIDRSFKVTQDALALARLTPTSFDKVILVGGSTRIPLVRKRVETFFGAPPMDRVNPDEVVAIGAAIQAAALTEGTRKRNIPAPPAVPTGQARTMPGLHNDTDATHTAAQLEPHKLKPAFGSEPPSFGFGTRTSNPPGFGSNPAGFGSAPGGFGSNPPGSAPGGQIPPLQPLATDPRKMTRPGVAPAPNTTQPMGARPAPGARPAGPGGPDEDPSIASFPDLAAPTPFEWFPSQGAPSSATGGAPKPGAQSERSFGPAVPKIPESSPELQTLTQVVMPSGATDGFGAIDEPPSLYSTPSASVPSFPSMSSGGGMPSPLGVDTRVSGPPADMPAGQFGAVDLSIVSMTGVSTSGVPGVPGAQPSAPFGAVKDLSLVSTSGVSGVGTADANSTAPFGSIKDVSIVSTTGVPTQASAKADAGFGHVSDLSLVANTASMAVGEMEAITQARNAAVAEGAFDDDIPTEARSRPEVAQVRQELKLQQARPKPLPSGAATTGAPSSPASKSGGFPAQTGADARDDTADLPAVARSNDLPAVVVRGKRPEIKKSGLGLTPSGGSPMLGKPPPIVAPQPFGPMEKIADDAPPSRTMSMQGRPATPGQAPKAAPSGGGARAANIKPPPAPATTQPMPARSPLNTTAPLGATSPQAPPARVAQTQLSPQAPVQAKAPSAAPPPPSLPPAAFAPTVPSAPPPAPPAPPPAPFGPAPGSPIFGSAPPGAFGSAPPGIFGSAPPGTFGSVGPGMHAPIGAPPPPPPAPPPQHTAPFAQPPQPFAQPSYPPPQGYGGPQGPQGGYAPPPPPPAPTTVPGHGHYQDSHMPPPEFGAGIDQAGISGAHYAAPVLVDVTPRALVVETAGGYTDTIIPRNAKIPCERTRRFATGRDMQTTVRVRVGQGENQLFPQNTFLGEVELSGLRPAPRGEVVVAVTFEVDADGSLRVRARDVQTGQEARATLQLIGVADESSVVMMINRFANQPVVGGPSS